ncbi:MAG TPA: response regulator [Chloroflexota bacterium]|nr:response regulator [Chloroflexota bacterium]
MSETIVGARPLVGCCLAADVIALLDTRTQPFEFLPFQTADQARELLTNQSCRLLVIDLALIGDQVRQIIAASRAQPGEVAKPVVYVASQNRDSVLLRQLVDDPSTTQVLFQPLDTDELVYQIRSTLGFGDERSVEHANDSVEQAQNAVAALWGQFRETNFQRIETIERATMTAPTETLTPDMRREAERAAHKLAGAVGTFGFLAASRCARDIEQILAGTASLTQPCLVQLSGLVVDLRRDLEASTAPPVAPRGKPSPARPNRRSGHLLLVLDDAAIAESVASEGRRRALYVDIAQNVAEARRIIANGRPDVVLVDVAPADGSDQGMAFLAELANAEPPVPVVILTQRDSLVDRIEVAALGGSAFLRKPLSPAKILDAVCEVLASEQNTESVILAVDDDPVILNSLQAILGTNHWRTICLDDPMRFWEMLDATTPDLVVLDVDMPHVSGIELCKVIRNEQRWRTLPVIILTAHTDPATVHRVFAAGADDYVSKPFVGPELVNRISNRLERTRLYQRLAEVDALTGVSTRRKTSQVIERYLGLAKRRNEPFTLAVLDVDYFKQINDRHGHLAGDETLRRLGEILGHAFRHEDVVGRWGGEEFIAGMYGMNRQVGIRRLTSILEKLRHSVFLSPNGEEFRVTFSAGAAQCPEDGTDLATLYRAADAALYRAKANGRNCIVGTCQHHPTESRVEHVDILIVDDDINSSLLRHTLEVQGYRVQWSPNGQALIDVLAEDRLRVRARVVVLSVDLPDLAGRNVLQELRHADLLKGSRVIVLSARWNEAEEIQAFELGAFDYVAKPLSLPVIVQRIRRALND